MLRRFKPPRRRKLCVVTHDFPTQSQPYRGAPIWQTLTALQSYADMSILCPVPKFPGIRQLLGRRSGIFNQYPLSGHDAGAPRGIACPYFAIPKVSHSRNGETLMRSLRSAIATERPDVILSYWIYPDSYAAVKAGEALGIPVVVGSRGSDLKVVESSPAVRERIGYTMTHASAILTVSGDLAHTAAGLGAPVQKIHTLINGVDGQVFQPLDRIESRRRLQVECGTPLVLFVGRLVAMKGVRQLVDAIGSLNKRGSGRWKIALIGEGPEDQAIRRQAESLGIAESVIMLGKRKPTEIADWMNAADLFCLPSASEGCPNVVREALSCGCPVVASEAGGIPELVDEATGVLVRDCSDTKLAQALDQAIQTRWDRAAIAKSRQRGWDQVAQETLAVCESVIPRSLAVSVAV